MIAAKIPKTIKLKYSMIFFPLITENYGKLNLPGDQKCDYPGATLLFCISPLLTKTFRGVFFFRKMVLIRLIYWNSVLNLIDRHGKRNNFSSHFRMATELQPKSNFRNIVYK